MDTSKIDIKSVIDQLSCIVWKKPKHVESPTLPICMYHPYLFNLAIRAPLNIVTSSTFSNVTIPK